MTGPAAASLDVDGTRIAWEARGREDGPTVVLLHSLGLDAGMWALQSAALEQAYRVVVMDMRGHGRSAAPPGPYTLERLGLDVLAVADAAGADRFELCGLSIGGLISQWLAIHHPGRVASLVLADTAPRIGTEESWTQRIETVRAGGMAAIEAAALQIWFSEATRQSQPALVEACRQRLLETSTDGYAGCCAALAEADLRDAVPAIRARTLVIGGTLDVSTPPAAARELHEAIVGSELAIIDGAAHISNLDASEAFTRLLMRHLDGERSDR